MPNYAINLAMCCKNANWFFDAKLVFKKLDISFLELKSQYGNSGQQTLPASLTSKLAKKLCRLPRIRVTNVYNGVLISRKHLEPRPPHYYYYNYLQNYTYFGTSYVISMYSSHKIIECSVNRPWYTAAQIAATVQLVSLLRGRVCNGHRAHEC